MQECTLYGLGVEFRGLFGRKHLSRTYLIRHGLGTRGHSLRAYFLDLCARLCLCIGRLALQ